MSSYGWYFDHVLCNYTYTQLLESRHIINYVRDIHKHDDRGENRSNEKSRA